MAKQTHEELKMIRMFLIDNHAAEYVEKMNDQVKANIERCETLKAEIMWLKIQQKLNLLAREMMKAIEFIK